MKASYVAGGLLAAIALRRALGSRTWHGVWWETQERFTLENADTYIARLKRYGLDEVCIMLSYGDHPPQEFRVTHYSVDGLLRWSEKLKRAGIKVTLCPWPRPTTRYVDSIAHSLELRRLVRSGLYYQFEYDAEEPWMRGAVQGFADRDAAGRALAAVTREAIGRLKFGINTPPEYLRPVGQLARHVDYCCMQAYSYANTDGAGVVYPAHRPGGIYGPGAMQELAARRVEQYSGAKLAIGLATARQAFPGTSTSPAMSEIEGLVAAYRGALAQNPIGIRWWSSSSFMTTSAAERHPSRTQFFDRVRPTIR